MVADPGRAATPRIVWLRSSGACLFQEVTAFCRQIMDSLEFSVRSRLRYAPPFE